VAITPCSSLLAHSKALGLIRATLAASAMPTSTMSARWGQAYRMGSRLRCVVTAGHSVFHPVDSIATSPAGTAPKRPCRSEHHRHGALTSHSSAVRPHPARPCSTQEPPHHMRTVRQRGQRRCTHEHVEALGLLRLLLSIARLCGTHRSDVGEGAFAARIGRKRGEDAWIDVRIGCG
jgi:hypothetical protein